MFRLCVKLTISVKIFRIILLNCIYGFAGHRALLHPSGGIMDLSCCCLVLC